MRRFTILALMGLVLALAVGLAALRGANEYWAGGLLLATPLLFGIALIGAACGKPRAWLGFAVLGGVYFALTFLGLSEGNLARLPTSRLLLYAHERVVPPQSFTLTFTTLGPAVTGGPMVPGGPPVVTFTQQPQASTPSGPPLASDAAGGFEVATNDTQPPNLWMAMLPGAADYQSFQAVGHCLLALLAGVLGAVIARRFKKGRRAIPAA